MDNVTEYGYAKDGKIYLKGYMDFPDRQIGVVKESEEASLDYFLKRFDLAKSKVEILSNSVLETQNKGSYLMKLIHMRTYLANFDGLGNFISLFEVLDQLETDIRDYIRVNRSKNLEIKEALLAETERFKESSAWNAATTKLKEIKLKWIKTGSAPREQELELNRKFDDNLNYFFDRRGKYMEEKYRIVGERTSKYEEIIEKMKLINANPPEDGEELIKVLQGDWKNVGTISKKKYSYLYHLFRKETERFEERSKRRMALPQIAEDVEPLTKKTLYCEFVEKLLEEEDEPSIEQIKEVQMIWKNIGKLKHPADRELNTRFKIACNEIFENHFLHKSARWNFDDFDKKNKFEQLKIKIRLIKDSIKTDENELSLFNDSIAGSRKPLDKTTNLKKINQINKLKTKNRILRKLQDQLLSNY